MSGKRRNSTAAENSPPFVCGADRGGVGFGDTEHA
jgi:hypothetical protein